MKLETADFAALKEWEITSGFKVTETKTGLINKVFLIETEDNTFILKKYTVSKFTDIDFTHAVMGYASTNGIPVPLPIATLQGDKIFKSDASFYSLYNFIEGKHPGLEEVSDSEVSSMGHMLSKIHLTLRDFPKQRLRLSNRMPDGKNTIDKINEFKNVIEAKKSFDVYDEYALTHLKSQEEWLKSHKYLKCADLNTFKKQTVHGDFQSFNILFDKNGSIAGVLDWDLTHYCPPELDLIRSLHHLFDFAVDNSCNFLQGYQQNCPIVFENLKQLALNYGLMEAHDLWKFKAAYIKGNEKVRCSFDNHGFISPLCNWERFWSAVPF